MINSNLYYRTFVVLLVAVTVAFIWVLLSRRSTARRLAALTARMGESDLQFGGRAGLETGLAKLERVVDSTVAVASEARSGQGLMEQALAAVPQGVVVGDDQGMPRDMVEDFQVTGLTHLLAVSGTNLTLVVGFLLIVGRWCGVRLPAVGDEALEVLHVAKPSSRRRCDG